MKIVHNDEQLKNLPISTNKIIFGKYYDSNSLNIPSNIKIVEFMLDGKFNGNVNFIPESIEEIYFGYHKIFSICEINNLPLKLKKLRIGNVSCKILNKKLYLPNLKYLKIFGCIESIYPNVLPKNLEHLKICSTFNQEIKPNVIPENVKKLVLGGNFNHPININVLPNGLTHF